jgi:hypothetical protein
MVTTYTTQFIEQLGSTDEKIDIKLEYCNDFNGDGFNDIRVTLSVADASNSGTENIIGVAFDIQNDLVGGLEIVYIGNGPDDKEASLISANGVTQQSLRVSSR